MKDPLDTGHGMKLLLGLSLLLSAVVTGAVAYKLATRPPPPLAEPDYRGSRATLFRVQASPADVVLLGDSLTDWGEWHELLQRAVINRGIAGDTTEDVRARLGPVLAATPKTIALMVGVNDLLRGGTVDGTAGGVLAIVKEIRAKAPGTRLLVQSILPIRVPGDVEVNAWIDRVNARLAAGAAAGGYEYLDVSRAVRGPDGALDQRFTTDGLHLSGEGYQAWANVLRKAL